MALVILTPLVGFKFTLISKAREKLKQKTYQIFSHYILNKLQIG